MDAGTSNKRGSGRPKKAGSQLLADMGVELLPRQAAKAGGSSGTSKKRGRPKSDRLTEALTAEIEDDEEEQSSKRAKTSKQQEILDEANSHAKGGSRKANGTSTAQEAKAPAKRGRGKPSKETLSTEPVKRSRKAKSSKAAAKDTDESADDADTEDIYVDKHGRHLWLMKAEPESRIENGKDVKFSIDDLAACTTPEPWSGVRNPVARNNMKAMKIGDLAFFYHSNAKKLTGVVGIMEIVGEATPDLTAFDKDDPYYDEKSDEANPKWYNVHVEFRSKLPRLIPLTELKTTSNLADMTVLKQSRLSVTKVTKREWDIILDLAGADSVPPGVSKATSSSQ